MGSSARWQAAAASVAVLVAVTGSACGAKSGDSGSSAATGPGRSAPAGKAIDYATLSGVLDGSGATFPKLFYEDAMAGMKEKAKGLTINYQGGGSGKGKTDLQEQVVNWAGSDSLVKPEDMAKFKGGPILYFPTVAAPITISYNLSGIGDLKLSPQTVAKVFQREVTSWDDPAIEADNPGETLPSKAIVVAHRSDGSGTTSNFTKYLKAAAGGAWKLDAGDSVNWPGDTQAGNGNAGVAKIVKDTDGAIGYVDFSDASESSLKTASIRNRSAKFVRPTLESASAALAGADVKDDLTYDPLNAGGDAAYPITAPTWIIVYQKQGDGTRGAALKGWLNYVLTDGQALATDAGFAPLPAGLQQKAVAQLDKLQVG